MKSFLVTLSTTVSLYVGIEDVLQTRYPRQILLRLDSFEADVLAQVQSEVAATLDRYGLEAVDRVEYRVLSFPVFRVCLLYTSQQFPGAPYVFCLHSLEKIHVVL